VQHDHTDNHGAKTARTISRYVFFGFVAVAAYFLIMEHRAHVIPFLPFLLLAACPLMHLFHHRGHSHGAEKDPERRPPANDGTGTHQH